MLKHSFVIIVVLLAKLVVLLQLRVLVVLMENICQELLVKIV